MNKHHINTIFVDCFNTIIIRTAKRKEIFKCWAKTLAKDINISWKLIYKTYNNVNFNMCFKKLFTSFTLQEKFEIVLSKVFEKLTKKYSNLNKQNFINSAVNTYIQTELDNFAINYEMIKMLEQEKQNGKKIYLVSDFYCDSTIISYWFEKLNILHIFNKVFSSCDFYKEKATGKLYKLLIKDLNLNPKNVKMYGDNAWSDILMARINKLQAQKVKAQRRIYEKK